MTFEEHQALGEELYRIRNRLLSISVELGNRYSVKLGDRCSKATHPLDLLRSDLDCIVFRENPDRDIKERLHVYYCSGRLGSDEGD